MRLIDADLLKIQFTGYNTYGRGAIIRIIDNMPTVDEVGIVRCEDCKFASEPHGTNGIDCIMCGIYDSARFKDYYCAFAKEKEVEENDTV